MSATQLKWIAVALAALLLVWGGSELLSRGSDTISGSLALPRLPLAGVDTIAVVRGLDSLLVARQPSTAWTVNGHRAALTAVGELLKALTDTVQPELVAQDSSSFARLNVDSAAGRWLRLRGGGKLLLALIVGAHGSEFESVYLRRPGDRHVYLWRGRLASVMDWTADDWRDKEIAALQPDSVAALQVERGTDRYVLARAGKRWALSGAATDSAAVARYLGKLHAIVAAGFATPGQADSAKLAHRSRRLTVRAAHGTVLLALAFDSTRTGFVVRHLAGVGGEGATVYRMTSWDVDGLTPASHTLLPAK